MVVITYFRRLLSLWIVWVFTGIDILAFIIGVSTPSLYIPVWGYWTIAGVGFFVANLILFNQLQEKINRYEANEARLQIEIIYTDTFITNVILTLEKRYDDGLDDDGIPIESNILAGVNIENLGIESGELLWNVDVTGSEIPNSFALNPGETDGELLGQLSSEVPGRTRVKYKWNLKLVPKELDPRKFAKALSYEQNFKIDLNYRTKRIGSVSAPTLVVIAGDFSGYKKQLIQKWKARGLDDLIDIIQSKGTN